MSSSECNVLPAVVETITDFPTPLLANIIGRLEIKGAAATSILSRRWKYVWLSIPSLYIRYDGGHGDGGCVGKFLEIGQSVLLRHWLNLKRFSLICQKRPINLKLEMAVYRWILHIVNRAKLTELFLRVRVDIPIRQIFICKSLEYLHLNCKMVIPPEVQVKLVVQLPKLKRLTLISINFSDKENFVNMIKGCPALTHLSLLDMRHPRLHVFNIDSDSLIEIEIQAKTSDSIKLFVELVTPSLRVLKFRGINGVVVSRRFEQLNEALQANLDLFISLGPQIFFFEGVGPQILKDAPGSNYFHINSPRERLLIMVKDDVNKNNVPGGVVASVEEVEDLAVNPSDEGEAVNIIESSDVMIDGSGVAYVEHSVLETSQALEFGTSLNADPGNETCNITSATATENGVTEDVHGSAAFHQPVDGSALSAEEERLWSIVRANSLDFNVWTVLIDDTERMSEGDITRIRKVYDSFLTEFPLCYGYWKKYADHEARIGSMDRVEEVYEKSVQGMKYSVDMWLHYCVFAMGTCRDPETIRRLFERGLVYVGTDYLSFPLWDKYIEYEYTQRDWRRVAMLYTRVLENPNQQLDRYFEGFKELVASRPLSELRTDEEAAAAALADSRASDQTTEGETHPDSVEQSNPVSASLKEAEELEKYISIREEMFKKAKEFDSRIVGFETAMRRPYFDAGPQNVAELENWHSYLDFMEGLGNLTKAFQLLPFGFVFFFGF